MRCIALLALAVALASADSIKWTGIAGDNQWTNHINWYPAQVPGANDDVSIPSGVVQVTISTSVNSLNMGYEVTAPANLTLFQAFLVGNGGLTVNSNGNLFINTGLQQVFATATIGGNLMFIDGTLSGSWTVTKRAYADLGNANEKGFSGCAFVSQGQLSLGGVIVLNQSSTFTLSSGSQTTADTNLIVQGMDGTTVSFDASAAHFTYSTGVFTIQAPVLLGDFTLQSGNMTILDSLTFKNLLNIPSGSFVVALGNAVLNLTAGATGAGVLTLSSQTAYVAGLAFSGAVNMLGGAAIISGESSIGILTIQGGNAVFSARTWAGQLNLMSGTTSGSSKVVAKNLLVSTKGLTLGSSVVVNGTATFYPSTLTFGQTGALTIDAGATATATGALLLTGPAFIAGLTNNGVFTAQAAVSSQNINIQGSGAIKVSSTLTVNTATVSQASVSLASGSTFSGSNTFLTLGKVESANGGVVKAVLGDYTLTCQKECDNVSTPGSTTPTASFTFTA